MNENASTSLTAAADDVKGCTWPSDDVPLEANWSRPRATYKADAQPGKFIIRTADTWHRINPVKHTSSVKNHKRRPASDDLGGSRDEGRKHSTRFNEHEAPAIPEEIHPIKRKTSSRFQLGRCENLISNQPMNEIQTNYNSEVDETILDLNIKIPRPLPG